MIRNRLLLISLLLSYAKQPSKKAALLRDIGAVGD
jgi:hypothetical protein